MQNIISIRYDGLRYSVDDDIVDQYSVARR